MTAVNVFNGEQLLVQIETAPGSGAYDADCLINTQRGIKFSSSIQEDLIPDCDNPGDPAWVQLAKDGLKAEISGTGKTHVNSVPFWFNFFRKDVTLKCRVKINVAGGVIWQGGFKCSDFDAGGDRKKKVESQVSLKSDGEVVLLNADGTPYVFADF